MNDPDFISALAKGSEKIVDLNARRLDKAAQEVAGVAGEVRVVQLICCSNCGSSDFKLTHESLIACGKCQVEIQSLRWYDVNLLDTPPPTRSA